VIPAVATTDANYGQKALIDHNRDGVADAFASTSTGTGTTATYQRHNNVNGTLGTGVSVTYGAAGIGDAPTAGSAFGWDYNGDGWVDLVMTDDDGGLGHILRNNSGAYVYQSNNYLGANPPSDANVGGAIDLDNDGWVDIYASQELAGGDADMYLMRNNGAGQLQLNQTITDAFWFPTRTDRSGFEAGPSWADFNNDGFLDLFTSADGNIPDTNQIYFNDGFGRLNTTPLAWESESFGDTWNAPAGVVDWNADGFMDVVEGYQSNNLIVSLNNGTGGFSLARAQQIGSVAHSGFVVVDTNWDGAQDLVTMGGSTTAGTNVIYNNNLPQDGTHLHIRIVDDNGINIFYSNTVQLLDAAGAVVSTQVINQQAGRYGANDATGVVNFYGLNPNATYSVRLIATNDGVAYTYNGLNHQTWGDLSPMDSSSYVLSTGGVAGGTGFNAAVNGTLFGGGYDDVFFATQNANVIYDGNGGWNVNPAGTGTVWHATLGMDVVDYKYATVGVTIALANTDPQNTGYETFASFRDIEGIRGGSGNDAFTGSSANNIFEGRAGNDTYNLTSGGYDILEYKVVTSGVADGGNGSDTVIGFTVDNILTNNNADIIDLTDLLSGYTGNAHVYFDVTASAYVVDQASMNAGLSQYVNVVSGTNTQIQVDATGNGAWTTVATLNGVNTTLADLLANHQLLIG
jgi:hypothetical protein